MIREMATARKLGDVLVIGGGIIGSSIAYELASRGASVVVLDPRAPGQGATQAAAGMLAPYIEGFGKPIMLMARRSLDLYDGFIARVRDETGDAVEYRRTGSLQVVTDEDGARVNELNALHEAAMAAGIASQLLDGGETRDLEPQLTPDVVCGHFIPDHGFVVPTNLCGAVVHAAKNKGVMFDDDVRAVRISRSDAGLLVETSHNRIEAERVVVAAGTWSGEIQLEGIPALPVRPVRGQLVQLGTTLLAARRIVWGDRCYIVPSTRIMLSVGATVEEAGFDERATVAGIHDLLDAAAELMPVLWQSGFIGARVGLRPGTPDDMPIIGSSRVLPGVTFATGHFRNGILLAPLTARVVADLVLENRPDEVLEQASPARFGEY